MRTKLSQFSNLSVALAVLVSLHLGDVHADEAFQFFKDQDIDFWKGTDPRSSDAKKGSNPTTSVASKNDGTQFPWNKYLNPKNDDFFKEGDYTPPAPFMEIVRNPSDGNIDKWFQYLQMKNDLMQRLQGKLNEYAAKHQTHVASLPQPYADGLSSDSGALSKIAAQVPAPTPSAEDAKRFRMRLYFDSHCPHCEHMMSTVKELMDRGYFVELRQIDSDTRARARIPFPVESAAPDELKRYQIDSVPVLLVGDLKAQKYFKIQGYQTTGDVLMALHTQKSN